MTLKELRALVQNNKEEQAPSYEHLRFGNIPIVACGKHSTGDITVYQNGFVLYTESNHYSIFHIDTVYNKNKLYLTVDERTVPERLRTIDASELRETAMDNLSQKEPFFANIEEVLFGG